MSGGGRETLVAAVGERPPPVARPGAGAGCLPISGMVTLMGFRVTVDQDECMSVGRCVADFPAGFGFDDEELATVLPTVGELTDQQILRAARNCPSRAIMALGADGNQVE